jgi:uncharacterized OB-fold protein
LRDDDFYWDGARAGRLLLQKCGGCGLVRHPPAAMCARCQSTEVEIVECSGKAVVEGWVASKHPARPDDPGRIVVRLALPEGVFMISNLQGVALADVRHGMPVEVFFEEIDGTVLPQFRPVREAAA